jgi:hypothetical protein
VQQRQLRAKWLQYSTIFFFAFVSLLTLILLTWRIGLAPNNASKWQMGFNSAFKGLKLSRRLLCSVRFVFVSTFNLQRGRAFVVGITNLSK